MSFPPFRVPRLQKPSPAFTTTVRMETTRLLGTFHAYHAGASPARKQAKAAEACRAVTLHAQLLEEILYPALDAVMTPPPGLADSTPEIRSAPWPDDVLGTARHAHEVMRERMAALQALPPTDPAFDDRFLALMRAVMHHLADVETVLLPQAERRLGEDLHALGARMAARRLALVANGPSAPNGHAPGASRPAVPATQAATWLVTVGALVAGGLLVRKALHRANAAP